jgi:ABC-type polysaccharide/polyol phosphate export permease
VWSTLGWQDVLQRYRRSLLGPLWLTISTGLIVVIMGPLYGRLFGQPLGEYFAFLAIGFVVWQSIAQTINDSCTTFITAESYIKQIKLPLSIHILRMVWKNAIYFFHNLIVVVLVLAWVQPPFTVGILLFPVGLLLLGLNGYLFGTMLAMVSARFRDIPLIVANVVQAAFFLTPILWRPEMLGRYQWTVELNPLFHFIEIVRGPLLGTPFRTTSWVAVSLITVIGAIGMLAVLSRFRSRIAYWV